MRKIILLMSIVLLTLAFTSCEDPNYSSQVTFNEPTYMSLLKNEDTVPFSIYGRSQPEGVFIKNILTYVDDDIEFNLLHIYNDNYTDSSRISSYGISIISDIDFQLDVYSGYNMIYSIDFQPNGSFEYKQTIPNNLFVGIEDNEQISVKIKPIDSPYLGDEIYLDTFIYRDNYQPSTIELVDYQEFHNIYYPVLNVVIVAIGFMFLYLIIVFVYQRIYKKAINKLLEQENKTRYLLSPYILAFVLLAITIVSGVFTNEFMKIRYSENHLSNIYVSATTTEVWDLDWDSIIISKLDVRVNGEEIATYMNVTDRIEITSFLDYDRIKENIDNIIEDKRNEPVCAGDLTCIMLGYWTEIELYLTDGSTIFVLSIRKLDDYTYFCAFSRATGPILMTFTVDEDSFIFSDVKNIHDEIKDALADYMESVD